MKKLLTKITSLTLSILFVLQIIPVYGYASTEGLTNSSSSYSYVGNSVKEITTALYNGDEFTAIKIINPDNTYTLSIELNGETVTSSGNADYAIFKNYADNYILAANTPMLLVDCPLYIEGNYSHRYVKTETATLYKSDFDSASGVLGVYSTLAGILNLPGARISGLASSAFYLLGLQLTYKVVTTTSIFDIHSSVTSNYLFKCYHMTSNCYDQSGTLIETREETRQIQGI